MDKWLAVPNVPLIWIGIHRALLAQMAVADATGLALASLYGDKRGDPKTAFARQMAMYLCHLVFRMNCADIARSFGRERTTVRHAVRRIEEARENPRIDRTLKWLEISLRRAGGFYAGL